MNVWLKRIIGALLIIVLIAAATRLAWDLLRPVVPALIAVVATVAILALVLRRPKQW